MTEPTAPDFLKNREAWDKAKAESFSFGNPKLHRDPVTQTEDLQTHETVFDAQYLEALYKNASNELKESGKARRILVEELGCTPLEGFVIGEPKFIINMHLHGDESGPAIPMFVELVKRIMAGDPRVNNVLIIPNCHEEASEQLTRGLALDGKLIDILQKANVFSIEEVAQFVITGDIDEELFAQKLTEKGFHVSHNKQYGYFLDLNRQFIEKEHLQQPDLSVLYPKARQLLRMIHENAPDAVEGFSVHADNEVPDISRDEETSEKKYSRACYLYDTPKLFPEHNPDQETEQFVKQCVNNFRRAMAAAGLELFTGVDDEADDVLGKNPVENGYCLVPANEKKIGEEIVARISEFHDQTFETSLVRWGMERYWCFETAGWINIDQRKQMCEILLDTIVLPIMARLQESELAKEWNTIVQE